MSKRSSQSKDFNILDVHPVGRAYQNLQAFHEEAIERHEQRLQEEQLQHNKEDEQEQDNSGAKEERPSNDNDPKVGTIAVGGGKRPPEDKDLRPSANDVAVGSTLMHNSHEHLKGRSEPTTNTNEEQCFEEEDKLNNTLSRSINRELEQAVTKDIISGEIQRLGNTPEQENRLIDIYNRENNAHLAGDYKQAAALYAYDNYMHNVALKRGREHIDRAQSGTRAIAHDYGAYRHLLNTTDDKELSELTVLAASPNTANMNTEQENRYLDSLRSIDQTIAMAIDPARGGRGEGSGELSRYTGTVIEAGVLASSLSPLKAQDDRFAQGELADLKYHRDQGKEINPSEEYKRQLGEHIRARGREGIALSKEQCREDQLSSDQLIASRMYIAGHEKANIEKAIQENSPALASPDAPSAKLYIKEEIEPQFENALNQQARELVDEARKGGTISNNKRFDYIRKELLEEHSKNVENHRDKAPQSNINIDQEIDF